MPARFLFDLNSPYAYLAAQRVDDVLPGEVLWEPIVFGALLAAQQRVPWSMREETRGPGVAEVERRAGERGLPPLAWPQGWPGETYSIPGLRAVVWALASDPELGRAVAQALFRAMFVHGRSLADLETVLDAVEEAGVARNEVAAGIQDQAVKDALRTSTDAAIAAGVPGVPTVVAGDELFWGDDRLENAAAAIRRRASAAG